jgi:steroid 5-alpha reductase family enzyme
MVVQLLLILVSVLVYITVIFGVAWTRRRLDIVDIAWGGGFIVAALVSLMMGPRGPLQYLVTGLVIIWGIRLGSYIFKRVIASKDEDPRYADMRKKWKGGAAINAYFRIFVVQGILATIVSMSVITINLSDQTKILPIVGLGVVIWMVGFLFESTGDRQLHDHLANPKNKGKLMTSGLWKYTRHPNYFGEALQWWGIATICLSVPLGILGMVSPLVITFLLLFVSGVPLTEKRFEGRPGWAQYKQRTSVFIPLPPRRSGIIK